MKIGQSRTSYKHLIQSLQTNPTILHKLITYHYLKKYTDPLNRSSVDKLEIESLAKGMWIEREQDNLKIAAIPDAFPWNTLRAGDIISHNIFQNPHGLLQKDQRLADEFLGLITLLYRYTNPSGLKIIPAKTSGGTWLEASALKSTPSIPPPILINFILKSNRATKN